MSNKVVPFDSFSPLEYRRPTQFRFPEYEDLFQRLMKEVTLQKIDGWAHVFDKMPLEALKEETCKKVAKLFAGTIHSGTYLDFCVAKTARIKDSAGSLQNEISKALGNIVVSLIKEQEDEQRRSGMVAQFPKKKPCPCTIL